MRRRALLLAFFFSISFSFLFTPALPAKDKPKTATSNEIRQDFSKFVENCLRCHQKQNAEADLPYHHPIREAKLSCPFLDQRSMQRFLPASHCQAGECLPYPSRGPFQKKSEICLLASQRLLALRT